MTISKTKFTGSGLSCFLIDAEIDPSHYSGRYMMKGGYIFQKTNSICRVQIRRVLNSAATTLYSIKITSPGVPVLTNIYI